MKNILKIIAAAGALLAPAVARAENMVVPIFAKESILDAVAPVGPGVGGYVAAAHTVGVVIVAALAVVSITYGAILVFGESAWGDKRGREKIWNAVWGLLLAAGSYVILGSVSRSLLSSDFTLSTNLGAKGPGVQLVPGEPQTGQPSNNSPENPDDTPTPGGQNGGMSVENPGGGVSQITTFGGAGDIRTKDGYALGRKNYSGNLGAKVETDKFGTSWYYMLDGNGNKIPYPGGSPNGFVGYNETGAVSQSLLRNLNTGSYYAAYPLNGHSIPGIPSSITNTALRGRSLVVVTTSGQTVRMTIIDRGPVAGTKLDVSNGAAAAIKAGGGISTITLE
jgi:hypothetical protein